VVGSFFLFPPAAPAKLLFVVVWFLSALLWSGLRMVCRGLRLVFGLAWSGCGPAAQIVVIYGLVFVSFVLVFVWSGLRLVLVWPGLVWCGLGSKMFLRLHRPSC
jgi:hypothetical protein